MKFFLVWEQFDSKYSLVEKGYQFLPVDDVNNIDVDVGEFAENIAKSKGVDPLSIIITACQPMPE